MYLVINYICDCVRACVRECVRARVCLGARVCVCVTGLLFHRYILKSTVLPLDGSTFKQIYVC